MADLKIVLVRCREGIVARDERIAQLEEALRGALYIIKELQFAGPKDWHVIEELHTKAQTALASLRELRDAEAPEKEG